MAHKAYGLNELREMYLKFFESKGHLRLPSFSLVPQNDKSILLINAGMTPMKPWFTGEEDFDRGVDQLWREYHIPLILLSMGSGGSRAYCSSRRAEQPAFLQESTIETTGAGDTFGACCLHHILKYGLDNLTKQQLKEMLTFANAAASIITTRKGALRVMPSLEEIQRLL